MTDSSLPDGAGAAQAASGAAQPVAPDERRLFISYASADVAVATTVCTALESHGWHCWIAPRDVAPGALYADAIVHGINGAQALVLVLSAASAASPHVLREVERASAKRKTIIALRIDAAALTTSLEYFLSASHWLDAAGTAGVTAALPTLVDALGRLLNPDPAHAAADHATVSGRLPAYGDIGRVVTGAGVARSAPLANRWLVGALVLCALTLGYLVADRFWLSRRATAPAAVPALSARAPDTVAPIAVTANEKAIAVMPFIDLSERKDQQYFADGLSEELIDLLSKLPQLRVAARTSSFYFKTRQATIGEIARALGVAHILEGSIRKSGKTLRVTAQLVRADNGYHVWSETYDRKLDDIFKVQDDIAGSVVKSLKVSLIDQEQARVTPAANAEAYNQYLQGRFFVQLHTKEGVGKAISYYNQAIALDPAYEPAWSGLAFAYGEAPGNGLMSSKQALERSRSAVAKALQLDPKSPRAHVALGLIHMNEDWDWEAADREFGQALAADAGNATVLVASGVLNLALGRSAQATALFQQAVARDPLHASSLSNLGVAYFADGKYAQAESAFRKSLEIKPGASYTHNGLALVLLEERRLDAALEEMRLESSESWRLQGLAIVYSAMHRRAESDAALAELVRKYADDAPYQIATVYAYRGEVDDAFGWLERARASRDATLSGIKADPLLRALAHDARFKELLLKLRLPA